MVKWSADRRLLAERLKLMERVLPRRTDVGAAGVFHVEVRDGFGWVWGGSEQERLRLRFDAAGGPWEGAIPAVEFCRLVEAAPGERVEVWDDSEGRGFRLTSGSAGWVLGAVSGESFQRWEDPERDVPFLFEDKHRGGLAAVRYAVCFEDSRPALCQVRVAADGVSASDGLKAHRVVWEAGEDGFVLFPELSVGLVSELAAAFAAETTGFFVYQSESFVSFDLAPDVVSYLVGRRAFDFPDLDSAVWERAASQRGFCRADRRALLTALSVADVTLDQDRVALRWRGGRLSVVGSGNRGIGQMSVACLDEEGLEGQEVHCSAVDLRALVSACHPVDGLVDFRVQAAADSDPDDPGLVCVSGVDADGSLSEGAIRAMVIL